MKNPAANIHELTSKLGDIGVVLGTRPEIIKLAGVITELGTRARVIHTGQHWDDSTAGQFFQDLGIGAPDIVLPHAQGGPRGAQIATGISELTAHFSANPLSAVIVQGDTNSTSVGAQSANYAGVPLIHVDAGLRSHDRNMPEEINRLVVGALSDVHCAASKENAANLLREGVDPDRIIITGNTVIESTLRAQSQAKGTERANLSKSTRTIGYILATIRRPENTDSPQSLERILRALAAAPLPVVFTMHPQTQAAIRAHHLEPLTSGFEILTGVGHAGFLDLAAHATLIVSDSGGLQEEVTVLKKRLLVIRRSTERPESIEAGFAKLVTPEHDISQAIHDELLHPGRAHSLASVASPYGAGNASNIIAFIARNLAAAHPQLN
ncbi:non-hydrolyzing UDP-N-acetylglucosamine 2-epimerase [Paeniglutamicibacter sp. NPDC012692]|uniref:non-hydrolyzing UDP-N-acetylglucosamine 2-epimerase n=1 Tax=Paeniglutamicibacter sp. NPDC012692 TaxID=3364388 RepID=UPI0036AA1101